MSFRDDMMSKLDIDKNGKVNFRDFVTAAEDRFGAVAVRWGAGGFAAGAIAAFVLLKVVLK